MWCGIFLRSDDNSILRRRTRWTPLPRGSAYDRSMSSPIVTPSRLEQFNTLTAADVLGFVNDRRGEDLTLDFKQAQKNFSVPEERKVLARTISAFANSSGGLIVWGIDARKGKDD